MHLRQLPVLGIEARAFPVDDAGDLAVLVDEYVAHVQVDVREDDDVRVGVRFGDFTQVVFVVV